MPSYKLIYFNGRGRAELCRLLFAFAGQAFEDVRMDSDQWKAYKEKTLMGQLPVMEIDGKLYSQSSALAQFLAREFGLYGKNNTDALEIDQVTCILQDLFSQAIKVFFAEEGKKEAAQKEFKENQVPKFLTGLEKLLKGNDFFVGKAVTLADIAVYDMLFSMCARFPTFLEKFPALQAHKDRIANLDNIKKYVAKRPETQF